MSCYVIMGVSGYGKTSVGTALPAVCAVEFVDGDDLHPAKNIGKMSCRIPLDDEDCTHRLADLGRRLAQQDGAIAVGCSALNRKDRDWIRAKVDEPVHCLHPDAPQGVLQERVRRRTGHFMPAALLQSRHELLQHLQDDEFGQEINIACLFSVVIAQSESYLRSTII